LQANQESVLKANNNSNDHGSMSDGASMEVNDED